MEMDEDKFYEDAVLYCYDTIQKNLKYDEIVPGLVSNIILTIQEKQDLEALQVGSISRAGQLLDIIFKRQRNLTGFVNVLKHKQPKLAALIEAERQRIYSGEKSVHFQVMQQQVKRKYKTDKCNIIEKLPGESFTLDISDESMLMPLDISAHVIDRTFLEKQIGKVDSKDYEYKYQRKDISCVEAIFGDGNNGGIEDRLAEETSVRFAFCTGIAGMGKTVTLHRLAWQWCLGLNQWLKQFELFFLIPLGNVGRYSPLLNILSEEADGLSYIQTNQKKSLHEYLEINGDKVVFALDGGDEMDIPEESELGKLISGELYPKVKILFVSRPGINSWKHMNLVKVDAKIHINGTNREGMMKHIKASIIKTGAVGKDECQHILDQCMKFMSDISILYVPLYLTLFTVLFDQHWVKFASFTHFEVPKTMTELYNSFMCVIIKLWLKRLKRRPEAIECGFKLSPFEEKSRVPIDIQAKLFNIGRMSFDTLMKKQHLFSKKDLVEYLIDIKDIGACGIFCTEKGGKTKKPDRDSPQAEPLFTFRHQTFQEYVAALYLSHMQFKDAHLRDHVTFSERQRKDVSQLEVTLEEFFMPVGETIKFVFGLSPKFGCEILECCYSDVNVAMNEIVEWPCVNILDLTYEAELATESGGSSEVLGIFNKSLEHIQTVKRTHDIGRYRNCYSSLNRFVLELTESCCQNILQMIYNITVKRELNTCQIYNSEDPETTSDKIVIPNLDISCYCLLSRFKFEQTKNITIHRSMIMDPKNIKRIFPFVSKLCVEGHHLVEIQDGESEIDDHYESDRDRIDCCLEVMTLKSQGKCRTLPMPVVCNILQEKRLKAVSLNQVDIFSSVPNAAEFSPQWFDLIELTINKLDINQSFSHIQKILKATPKLQKLQLKNSDDGNMCDEDQALELMNIILTDLPSIRNLALIHVFDQNGSLTMCHCLPKMPHLKNLCLGEWDILDLQDHLLETVDQLQGLRTLEIVLWHNIRESFSKLHKEIMSKKSISIEYTIAKVQ